MPRTSQALVWYRKAAEQGNAIAQYTSAAYAQGRGVPQDYAQAVSWYRKAAEQGDADAQVALGPMYPRAAACRRTMRRPSSGSARPPIRGTPSRKASSVRCIVTAEACRRTMSAPTCGST